MTENPENLPRPLYDFVEQTIGALQIKTPEDVDKAHDYFEDADILLDALKSKRVMLSNTIKALEGKKSLFREYILNLMAQMDTEELSGQAWRFVKSRSKPKLVIEKDDIETKYLREVISLEPDKEMIEADLNKGLEVKGAYFEPSVSLRKYSRRVKGEK